MKIENDNAGVAECANAIESENEVDGESNVAGEISNANTGETSNKNGGRSGNDSNDQVGLGTEYYPNTVTATQRPEVQYIKAYSIG